VVFDASGGVVHSNVKRALPQLRELRSLVTRELDQRREPDEQAELVWDELWKSGWTVARVDDADGRRYLTLRRARAHQPTLTTSERAVLALAREGRSIKWIAAELGISSAGASTQLQSGLHKLGLEHRLELLRLR
jgi:DNA-binding CsgD family transcriptional regulator